MPSHTEMKRPTRRRISAILATALVLSACGGGGTTPNAANGTGEATPLDQTHLCRTGDWQLIQQGCKPGQRIIFLPQSWGNDQLPVMFAALNCDLRYQVVMTKGAVTCIFGPIKPNVEAPAPASAASAP